MTSADQQSAPEAHADLPEVPEATGGGTATGG